MMGFSLLALLAVDGRTQLALVGAILFVHNSFAALQDVVTDALAVEVLPEDERGKANSFMWAAKNAGVAVGGGGGTIIAKHLGWPSLFVLNALIIWAVMLLVIAVRERPRGASEALSEGAKRLDWSELKRSFAFPTALLGIVVAMLAPAGYALTSTVLLRLMRVDLELSEEQIGMISGTIDPIASVGGALVGGLLADRIGVRKAMGGTMAIVGIALGVFAAFSGHWGHMGFLVGFTVVCTSAFAAYSAAALGFFMTLSNPAIAATQFALYMAAVNLTYAWSSPVGGRIADRYGPTATFAVGAVLQITMIGLLFLVDPKKAEERFRKKPPAVEGADAAA
jgi:PAT family beta-lactamase induction signal transducer AmpG